MSRVGIKLCVFYSIATTLCLGLAMSASAIGDERGFSIFLHLPFSFHGWLFEVTGLSSAIAEMHWIAAHAIYHSITLVVLYLSGWMIGKYFSWAFKSLL